MSEATGLSIVIEAKNALAVFTQPDHIESILQQVEKEVNSFVPDVSTKKGRDAIASLGLKVAKTKTYLDGLGKDLVTEYKEVPKKIDASRKTVRDRLDALKEKVLLPKLEYEAEQERIAAEAAYAAMWQEAHEMDARITAERAAKKESDHEMALLMNDAFDRDAKAKADEIERLRKAHEEFIAQQAAEKAKREVEEKARQEVAAAEQRERDAKLAQERAEQAAKDAAAKAERDAKELAERVEREKQEAIAAEKLKAQEEAERVQREAKQKEDARLAEEKRVSDEAAKRAADVEHRRTINRQAVADLIANGLPEDCAQKCVAAIAKNLISSVRITY
ncbi:cell envelope biogenesis protein TolA [Yersinia enterocolitica]|uniref:cell envelope biogenesis protein TolA n=1 Tax=Yersinia enterocolitica TaxID=630 RepID=UPI000BF100F0|nr:cell envelope biogenesis protein TolA [Yersinia enterocolitica]PNK73877.1 cell envelope biogenesis protein TolA [Yersinia enterocolitica]